MAHFLIHTDARWDLTGDEFASTNNSLTIGGCDQEGNVIYNDAVSYTHLDVYKRQGIKALGMRTAVRRGTKQNRSRKRPQNPRGRIRIS